MEAAAAAGGEFRVRSDHSDTLESRAGFARNFQRIGDRVVADIYLNDSYRHRDIVLETASKTPKLIGLSIDFQPRFELEKNAALMRVNELFAVDIVDEGAITHDGMFLGSGVDRTPKVELSKNSTTTMAEEKQPTIAECMSAIASLTKTVGELAAKMNPTQDKPADETLSAINTLREQLQADINGVKETLATVKKERAMLGIKSGETVISTVEELETERARLAAEKNKGAKTYLQLVAEKETTMKLKRSDAHVAVQREDPKAYEAHLNSKGIIGKAAVA